MTKDDKRELFNIIDRMIANENRRCNLHIAINNNDPVIAAERKKQAAIYKSALILLSAIVNDTM